MSHSQSGKQLGGVMSYCVLFAENLQKRILNLIPNPKTCRSGRLLLLSLPRLPLVRLLAILDLTTYSSQRIINRRLGCRRATLSTLFLHFVRLVTVSIVTCMCH